MTGRYLKLGSVAAFERTQNSSFHLRPGTIERRAQRDCEQLYIFAAGPEVSLTFL